MKSEKKLKTERNVRQFVGTQRTIVTKAQKVK